MILLASLLIPASLNIGDKVLSSKSVIFIEGIDSYTPDKQALYDYLDHLMNNVLSKRDKKKFGPLYDTIKGDQLSLIDRLNLA